MHEWDAGPKLAGTDFYLDSRKPRGRSFVSHAHSDHIAAHDVAIATPATLAMAEIRLGMKESISLDYGAELVLDPSHRLRLHPAGHVLGSAMSLVTRDDGRSLLYTGDFKLRASLTAVQAGPPPADTLVMESTFGKPLFRFPPLQQSVDKLLDLVGRAMAAGRQAVVMGYSLGKAQEIVKILTSAGFVVTEHGAVHKLSEEYERQGVSLGPRRKYKADDFRGPRALDLAERGVLVAPPQVARGAFVDQFDNPLTIMLSGWGMFKGAEFRYGVNHVLPISDHADFDELLELIARVRPKKVYTLHGFPEFADTLRARGIDAELARPDPQLRLFG